MNNQLQPKEVELLRHDENPSPEKMLDFEGSIMFSQPNQEDEVPKQANQKQSFLKSKLFFILMCTNGQLTFYFTGACLGFYNTLTNHIPKIYGWSDDQKDSYMSLVNSFIGIGAVFGAIIAWIYGNKFGRRTFILAGYLMFAIGSIMTLIVNTPILLIGRFLHGISTGFIQFAGPSYVMEFSPNEYKAYNSVALSFAFRFGMLFQYALGFGLPDENDTSNNYWRLTLAFPLIFLLISLIGFLFFFKNDTPYYILLTTNNEEATMVSLNSIYEPERARKEFADLVRFKRSQNKKKITVRQLLHTYFWQFLACIFMTITFQITGSSSLITFSNTIIEETGESSNTATLFTSLSSISDILGVTGGAYLISRIGRKPLFLTSCFLVSLNNVIFAIFGYINLNSIQKFFILTFRFVNSIGIDPVYWGYFAEVLPPIGCSMIIITFQALSALFVQTLLPMLSSVGVSTTMLIYGLGCFVMSCIVWLFMIEIRGKSREEQFTEFSQQNTTVLLQRLTTLGSKGSKYVPSLGDQNAKPQIEDSNNDEQQESQEEEDLDEEEEDNQQIEEESSPKLSSYNISFGEESQPKVTQSNIEAVSKQIVQGEHQIQNYFKIEKLN